MTNNAEKAIAIERFPERLKMAKKFAKADAINYQEVNAGEALKEINGGRDPDACINADLVQLSTRD
ncbi:hypothetical protein [Nostoc sp.]|uniref:hypothetical protein n=1 Tax=Nostoc sp. TaxID=1180 RepID=UPI003FA568A5